MTRCGRRWRFAYRGPMPRPEWLPRDAGWSQRKSSPAPASTGVYVHQSPELVSLLLQVDIDQRIPPQLYVAVAELLAWLYRIERGESMLPPSDHCPP